MADDCQEGDVATAYLVNSSHHHYDCRQEIKPIVECVDLISSLPDTILQHILSFIPTNFAIRTSVLSRRWRQIWCETPSLHFDNYRLTAESINKTLIRYTASKIKSFHLCNRLIDDTAPLHIDSWIEFAVSRNTEKLSLDFDFAGSTTKYDIPDSFYNNSSVKQLRLDLYSYDMFPRCTVYWTSLKNLCLRFCDLPDESAAKILSGCPILESLKLSYCHKLRFLDLSKALVLKRLEITGNVWATGSMVIVAPYIVYLSLRNCEAPCSLLDVSSLTEADLSFWSLSRVTPLADFQKMLADFRYLDSKGLNRKHGSFQTTLDTIPALMGMEEEAKFVFWVVEFLLENTKTVETMVVVLLGGHVSATGFNDLLHMVPTLCRRNDNVYIVLKRKDD